MSSPKQKSLTAIDMGSQEPMKIKVWQKSVRRDMNESDESPSQSQSSNDLPIAATVGRSGRVRKAKVVFDPSDMDVGTKRKSWSVADIEVKPKKVVRTSDVKKETPEPQQPSPETTKKIEQRRKTVGATHVTPAAPTVPAQGENGCIVCTRSDVKKGRFVVCINCPTRGHFTCLRNGKYLSSAPEEKHWQCDACLRCAQCNESKKAGNLFKCTLCFLSFHLNCMLERAGPVTKKKFKCDDCLAVEHDEYDEDDDEGEGEEIVNEIAEVKKIEVLPIKTPGNGFAGFSQEETTKSTTSGRSSSSGCSSDVRTDNCQIQQSRPDWALDLSRLSPITYSKKSSTHGAQSIPVLDTADLKSNLTDVKIEPKDRSPTPDLESSVTCCRLTKASAHSIDTSTKSKLKYDTDKSELKEVEKCVDIVYDRHTQMRPHESIPDVKKWDCDEVYTYFLGTTTAEYAHLFRENQIDGDALLLIKREDVLNRFNLKLGPALRLYSHIVTLQYKNNNPILAWDED